MKLVFEDGEKERIIKRYEEAEKDGYGGLIFTEEDLVTGKEYSINFKITNPAIATLPDYFIIE